MSLSEMLAKNNPTGDQRKTSESEYLRLLGRNTELVDKIKWLEKDQEELQERIDKAIEYIENTDTFQIIHTTTPIAEKLRDKTKKEMLEILKGEDKE